MIDRKYGGVALSTIEQTSETLPNGTMLRAMAAHIRELQELVDRAYGAFKIGEQARTPAALLTNIENTSRRAQCLSVVETVFFTPPEPEEEDQDYEGCPLLWGAYPAEYVEQFREALKGLVLTPSGHPALPEDLTATLSYKLVASSGFESEGRVPTVTPEHWGRDLRGDGRQGSAAGRGGRHR